MIWEWDNGGTNSQDHRRMDLTMSVSAAIVNILEISYCHGDHGSLFLLNIDELNKSFFNRLIKGSVLHLKSFDMISLKLKRIVLYDEERSLYSSLVSAESDLFVDKVSHNGHFFWNLQASSHVFDRFDESVCIIMNSDPITIHKHFRRPIDFFR